MSPPGPARVLQVSPEQQHLANETASEQRRYQVLRDKKLEDVLEEELKLLLAKTYEKVTERTALLKVGVALLAVKHRLGPIFGAALDEETVA